MKKKRMACCLLALWIAAVFPVPVLALDSPTRNQVSDNNCDLSNDKQGKPNGRSQQQPPVGPEVPPGGVPDVFWTIWWQKARADPSVFFAPILAAATIAQGWLIFRGNRVARIIAMAAKSNTDAAIAIEMPIIRGSPILTGGYTDRTLLTGVRFVNAGRTKAFPIQAQYGWATAKALPRAPIYTGVKEYPVDTIADAEGSFSLRLDEANVPASLSDDQRSKGLNLWFYCLVSYLDFMERPHTKGFCWKLGEGKFDVDPKPAYNQKA